MPKTKFAHNPARPKHDTPDTQHTQKIMSAAAGQKMSWRSTHPPSPTDCARHMRTVARADHVKSALASLLSHTLHPRRSALTCVGVEYMTTRSLSRARPPCFLPRARMVARQCLKACVARAELCVVLGIVPLRVLRLSSHLNCFPDSDGQGQ